MLLSSPSLSGPAAKLVPLTAHRPAPSTKRLKRQHASGGGGGNALVWLRQDLRLHDNETIAAAAKHAKSGGGRLAFLYVHSPREDGDDPATGEPEDTTIKLILVSPG